ncbi:MAG: hypothetical protein GY800_09065 [Planctomycetes bacterium]|nr:hypothetical protein [Planctomycetota bacterium]
MAGRDLFATPEATKPAQGFGLRADKTEKGEGYFGVLQRPDGDISTEISIGVEFDGKETEIPTLVPTLTEEEVNYLLEGNEPSEEIVNKAVNHAMDRMGRGMSPFKGSNEPVSEIKKSAGRDLLQTTPTPTPRYQGPEIDVRTGKPKPTQKERFGIISGAREAITGEQRRTPTTEALPEFRETGAVQDFGSIGYGNQLKMTAGLMATMDDQAAQDIIKKAIPEAEFFQDEKGNVIVDVAGEQSVLNRPGMSSQDAIRAMTQTLAFLTPSKLASFGKSILGKFGIGALGAGATEAGLQEVEQVAGAEKEREVGRIAGAAVMGGLGEVVGPVRQQRAAKKYARGIGAQAEEIPELATTIEKAGEAAERVGIDLTLPQKSGSPYALERQAFVASMPAGVKDSVKFLKNQNTQAHDAVIDAMRQIAPDIAVVTGPKKARKAADLAIEAQERIRSEAASPLYDAAKADHSFVDTSDLQLRIMERLDKFPSKGKISRSMEKALDVIGESKDIEQLHNAKREIDNMLSSAAGELGREELRELVKIKKSLVSAMEAASPAYKEAREKFIEMSPDVDEVKAILGEVPKMKDTQLKSLSKRILDPEQTNPMVVRQAKKAIADIDPEAWNELVRSEMERRLGRIRADVTDLEGIGAAENLPGQLHTALFKPAKNKNVLYAALDGEARDNMKYLETALKRASEGRPGGSQTGIRGEIVKEFRGGVAGTIRDFIASPTGAVAGAGAEKAYNQKVSAAARAIFDPAYAPRMKEIRRLNPTSAAAGKAMLQLLNDIEIVEEI